MFNTHVANLPDTGTVTVCAATSRPSTVFGAYGSLTPGTGFVLIDVTGQQETNSLGDSATSALLSMRTSTALRSLNAT